MPIQITINWRITKKIKDICSKEKYVYGIFPINAKSWFLIRSSFYFTIAVDGFWKKFFDKFEIRPCNKIYVYTGSYFKGVWQYYTKFRPAVKNKTLDILYKGLKGDKK